MSEVNIPLPGNPDSQKIVTPDLYSLFSWIKGQVFASMNCVNIGTIESFDAAKQTASISINYVRVVGERFVNYPVLVDCPVFFLTGGIGSITVPITKGDTCLVLFNDRDIDAWFATGQIAAPNSDRKHDINDGFALVGVRSSQNFLADFNEDGIQAKHGIARLALEDENETILEHGDSKLTLIDGDSATLESASAEVQVADKVKIAVGAATLKIALDALCAALTAWVDTNGDTPNGATVTAINAAKTLIDGVLE